MPDPNVNSRVTLRDVTDDNLRAVLRLKVAPHQEQFVASNAISLAEAAFARDHAWFRAIYADETPVGFVMLYDDPRQPTYYLWRFMIDARYQELGFGRQALQLVIAHVKTRPQATELLLSYAPGEGNPGPFYRKFGFQETGEVDQGEYVMRLTLTYGPDEAPAPACGPALSHIVLFKLHDPRPETLTEAMTRLRQLVGQVPTLRSLEVGVDVLHSGRSYDLALIARFDDRAGLEAYQIHPAHQETLAYLRSITAASVAVDFES